MAEWNAIIETSSGDLLRHGFSTLTAGSGETLLTNVTRPKNPRTARGPIARNNIHRWNGSSFDLITRPLADLKQAKRRRLREQMDAFTRGRYSYGQQLGFMFLANEGQTAGMTNRLAHIQQLGDWFKATGDELAAKRQAVNAATDAAGVRAVSLDLATLRSSDPGITVRSAQQITN